MSKEPQCPECDRMAAVRDDARALGEFLEWLRDEEDVVLTRHVEPEPGAKGADRFTPGYYPIAMSIEDLLAHYFRIDLDTVEREKQALLDWIRAQGDG